LGKATYDWKKGKVLQVQYCDVVTKRLIIVNTTTFSVVPLTKRRRTNGSKVLHLEPAVGDPPESLHEELSSISNQSLEFSPNPSNYARELVGIKIGKLAQYLVLRYLYQDESWVDLNLWDLGSKILEDWIRYYPMIPFESIKLTKSRRRELFLYALRFLLTQEGPGKVPNHRIRYCITKTLEENGMSSSYLWRSWEGMKLPYQTITSRLLTKLRGPGKPPKKTRRKRSSEDSRGLPRPNSRRHGLRSVSLPPTGEVEQHYRKWYQHFSNQLAYHYAVSGLPPNSSRYIT